MSGGCRCHRPRPSPNPRSSDQCIVCGKPIAGPGLTTDEAAKEFFDRLEDGMFRPRKPTERKLEEEERSFFWSFRRFCEQRERMGREKFGFTYLDHDGLAEAAAEAADFVVYLYLLHLRTRREGGEEDGLEVLLEASKEAIGALAKAMSYPGKRRGTP